VSLQKDKLAELIVYIARTSEGDERFGATKLNKLLFYADFLAYLRLGQAITGVDYQRLKNGPAPRIMPIVMNELLSTESVAVHKVAYHGYQQNKALALRDPDLSLFTAEEISLVCQLIESNWGRNAAHMSALSHNFIGWQLAKDGEPIPYSIALVSEREPTPDEIEYGQSLEGLAQECLAGNAPS